MIKPALYREKDDEEEQYEPVYDTEEFPAIEDKPTQKYTRDEILEVFGLTKEKLQPNPVLEKIKGAIPVVNLEGDFNLESIKPTPVRKASANLVSQNDSAALFNKAKRKNSGQTGGRPRKSSFQKEERKKKTKNS